MRFNQRLTPFIAVLFFTGCASSNAPNLQALYGLQSPGQHRQVSAQHTPPPVILIPGLGGSRLVDRRTGRELWPGSVRQLLFSRYRALKLSFDTETLEILPDNVEPRGITETAAGRDFYGRLLDTLVDHGGYQRTNVGDPITDTQQRRVYVFAYDWRQDNVRNVRKLARFLDDIRRDYQQPDLSFDLIAHSMGGLISRYFLRFGTEDVLVNNRLHVTWAGAPYINKIVLLGTPNLGSVSAIEGFVKGQKVGLRRIPQEVVATMPSTYQLFPHRIVDWLYDTNGNIVSNFDQYDAADWRAYQWNIFDPVVESHILSKYSEAYANDLRRLFAYNSERARRFSWAMTVCPDYNESLGGCPETVAEPPVRLVLFGGDCSLTLSRAVLEQEDSGRHHMRFRPGEIKAKQDNIDYERLLFGPGDGTVTKPSLLARDELDPYTPRHEYSYFPLAYSFFLCAEHNDITGNLHFQDNLLNVLLTRARPWELHKDHAYSRGGAN